MENETRDNERVGCVAALAGALLLPLLLAYWLGAWALAVAAFHLLAAQL